MSYISAWIDLIFVLFSYVFCVVFPSPISLGLAAICTVNYGHKRYLDHAGVKAELIKYEELKKVVDSYDEQLTKLTSKMDSVVFNNGVKSRVDMTRM